MTDTTERRFDWPVAHEAENLLRQHIAAFLTANPFARRLSERMRGETGTDFFEWIDYLTVPRDTEKPLRAAGFITDHDAETPGGAVVLQDPRTTLPRVIVSAGSGLHPPVIALRPESVDDFKQRHHLHGAMEGEPCSRYRRLVVSEENGTRLEAVERHGYRGFVPADLRAGELESIVKVKNLWRNRPRHLACEAEGFARAGRLLEESLALIGQDRTCEIFFEQERAYWQSRNQAARAQKQRQDQLGLGWGNHDHHTFRCSREHFAGFNDFLLRLGFTKRERFYAGAEAGWGAQILEQTLAGIVVFADVDLLPEETGVDFSSQKLPLAAKLGTVGLWVALHGESFLEAGMHHLEARFDFSLVREQWARQGIKTMQPFSDFSFLRQAFTEGERWPVRPEKVERLRAAGLLTDAQAQTFSREGALGSHLENLQRHGGFKGFNQKSVSAVITATDPRHSHFPPANA